MKKILVFIMVLMLTLTLCVGCYSEAQKVSMNVSKEADMFNVQRRVEVVNMRTDKPLLEVIGLLSCQQSGDGDLDIIVEVAPNVYKKHFVRLTEYTSYAVEDISGAYVDKYHYEWHIQPEAWSLVTIRTDN